MSELDEQLWAVISADGNEASGLTYAQAAELVRRLTREKKYGLCIVTTEAARRAAQFENNRTIPAKPTVMRTRKVRTRKN